MFDTVRLKAESIIVDSNVLESPSLLYNKGLTAYPVEFTLNKEIHFHQLQKLRDRFW
ncbi:hypothetical protein ACP8HI_00795 [Paenibacillus sp. FA6]|uniref:hypothetical protein n=1 Tax=Paenibacillus sp. FA6 TaxID=3413029 RepID=UPI003F65F2CA